MRTTHLVIATILFLFVGNFFFESESAYGVEPGTVKWDYWFNTSTGINQSFPAIADDGTVYIGDIDGTFYAFNPDGSVQWSYYAGGHFTFSPAIGNDWTVYIANPHNNTLYAFNPDGSLKWIYESGFGARGAPAIAKDGRVFIGMGLSLYGFSPDGDVVLDFPTNGSVQDPVIDINGNVYFVSLSSSTNLATLYAVNSSGWYLWSYEFPEFQRGSLAIGNGGAIIVSADKLYAFWPNGNLMWTFPTNNIHANPSASVVGSDGTIYVPGLEWFYAVNPDGTQKWRAITARQDPPPALIGADGTVYLTLTMNAIFAMEPVEPYIRWYYGTEGVMYSSPALSDDGVLYLVEEFRIVALNTDSYGLDNSAWPMYRANNKRTARVDKHWFALNAARYLSRRVKSSNLGRGLQRSLVSKLDSAYEALYNGRVRPAIHKLNAFANHVNALAGKKIPMEKACYLADTAKDIATELMPYRRPCNRDQREKSPNRRCLPRRNRRKPCK